MNHNDPTKMTDHIVKYLAGEASPAEAMQLDDWLADPANVVEFERVRQLWQRLPGATLQQTPATEAVWQELTGRLAVRNRPVGVRSMVTRLSIAAAVGMLVIATVWWWGLPKQATPPSVVALKEQRSAGQGEIKQLTMPDGSAITLHDISAIQYADNFGTSDRHLQLQGEAYFEVVPNRARPFTISIADLTIKVVGTAFNVKDITPSGNIEVQVLSGVVTMMTDRAEISVHKGQTGIYDIRRKRLQLLDTVDVNSLSYATHSFEFDNLTLREVYAYLGKAFNVQYRFEDPAAGNCRLTARFDNRSLDYILQILDATLNLTSSRQGDTIVINGAGCPVQ